MHGHEVRKLSRPPKRIVGLAARVHHSADGASSAIQAARRLTRGSWRRAREGVERKKLQPHGWHTVTPRIICKDAEGLVDFIKRVFGATGDFVQGRPAEVRIGDSVVMVSAAGERECFLLVRTPLGTVYPGDTTSSRSPSGVFIRPHRTGVHCPPRKWAAHQSRRIELCAPIARTSTTRYG